MMEDYIDLEFKNIQYSIKPYFFSLETKCILSNISGYFQHGKLTGIMGRSGSGKSSLLDILSGFKTSGVSGQIQINKSTSRKVKNFFHKNSCYIAQDNKLQQLLTVKESMTVASHLKLGMKISKKQKLKLTSNILESMGLNKVEDVMVKDLSGGQKKRLDIAVELINNPLMVFLDEPISGLDCVAAKHCLEVLKTLTNQGRNVVCSIHQPNNLLFDMFDHLYVIEKGFCVYQGSIPRLHEFLNELNLNCPTYHCPADYIIEISNGIEGDYLNILIEKIQNGKNKKWIQNGETNVKIIKSDEFYSNGTRPQQDDIIELDIMYKQTMPSRSNSEKQLNLNRNIEPRDAFSMILDEKELTNHNNLKQLTFDNKIEAFIKDERFVDTINQKMKSIKYGSTIEELTTGAMTSYPLSYCDQFLILCSRIFLCLLRDKDFTHLRVAVHLIMALAFGLVFYNIGNDAAFIQDNYNFLFYSCTFVNFTAFSSMTISIPLEIKIMCKEHFNRWYSIISYYLAIIIADIPIQIFSSMVYISITYFLTAQPMETNRFLLYSFTMLMSSFTSQTIGFLIGALLEVQEAIIIGPMVILPITLFSGYFLREKDTFDFFSWCFKTSYFKYSFESVTLPIFSYNRTNFECSKDYCHFQNPKTFLDYVGIQNADFWYSIYILLLWMIVLRILTYFFVILRFKYKRI